MSKTLHRRWIRPHRLIGVEVLLLMTAVLQRMHATHALLSTLFAKLTAQEAGTEALRLIGQNLLLRSNVLVADAHQLAVVSNRAVATRMHILLCILLGSLGPLLGACMFIGIAHRRLLRSLVALHEGAAALGQGGDVRLHPSRPEVIHHGPGRARKTNRDPAG